MDLIAFPDTARVWIFQADNLIADEKLAEVHDRVMDFAERWTSHQRALTATGSILHNRFVVLVVDESRAGASGCSIDKAMHFIQSLGHHYGVDFLNRHHYTYYDGLDLHTVPASQLKFLYENGDIDDETKVYDNMVNNKYDFLKKWVVPLGDSWIKRVVLK